MILGNKKQQAICMEIDNPIDLFETIYEKPLKNVEVEEVLSEKYSKEQLYFYWLS